MDSIQLYFNNLKNTIDLIDQSQIKQFIELLEETRLTGKKVIIFGNGGSGSTASHFVCDLNKGVSYNKNKKYKVICLNDNMASILAYANDISYDEIFVGQLKNFLEDGDLVVGISGSGNSKNILKAIEYANSKNNKTIGITGYDGGKLKEISNYSLHAPINDMQITEDLHMIFVHVVMKILYQRND